MDCGYSQIETEGRHKYNGREKNKKREELKGLDKFLSEALSLEIVRWSPIEGFQLDPTLNNEALSKGMTQLPVAIGLALKGLKL